MQGSGQKWSQCVEEQAEGLEVESVRVENSVGENREGG